MATLSLCICSQKYHFLAFTCTRLLTHSKLLHMLAIRFAKTLASIYIGTVIHQITLPQSKKHYLLFFCVKMVKTEGETILQVKKSWKFFMELPGTPKTGLLCRGNYIKKKKVSSFPSSSHTQLLSEPLFSFCLKSHWIFCPSTAIRSLHFAAWDDGAVTVKDSISLKGCSTEAYK